MRPRPYPRTLPEAIRQLIDGGALRRRPQQQDREELEYDGVDIIYDLVNMTPDRFERFLPQLLAAAEFESNRYPEVDYRFARWEVELIVQRGATRQGRRLVRNITRDYTASMSVDTDTMVYGDDDSIPVELGGQGRSLSDKAEAITNMTETGSPGAYVVRQNPYRVLRMIVGVRNYSPQRQAAIERRRQRRTAT